MAHSHDDVHVEVGTRAKQLLIGFLVLLAVLTVAGLIWLWPTPGEIERGIQRVETPAEVLDTEGSIVAIEESCEGQFDPAIGELRCLVFTVDVHGGPEAGEQVRVQVTGPPTQAGLQVGDEIDITRIDTADGPLYSYKGINRTPVFVALGALFVVAVIAVARWKGLFALLGLVVAGGVLVGFIIPGILLGKPGVAVALVGSTAIMFVVLYVAHGVSIRTSTALAGTMLGLAVTAGLGAVSVQAARLTGFADEAEMDLQQLAGGINFQELLVAAIIIGGLGVLNDTTITQSSAVFELRAAAPHLRRREIFASGMRIGRDHIASTIYTIVFAYAGSALVVIMLVYFTSDDLLGTLNQELFASEIVRTFGSAIGLILSVPITTGIAALTVGPARPLATSKDLVPCPNEGEEPDPWVLIRRRRGGDDAPRRRCVARRWPPR